MSCGLHSTQDATYSPSRPVQLRVQYIIHHSTSVSNLETAWLDPSHSSWTNDRHCFLLCLLNEQLGLVLWYTFGNDSNTANLIY